MMMPANYSVIAENEMTYVVGGGVIEAIGAVTAPVWGAANVKTFNTNLVTIIGNEFLGKFVDKRGHGAARSAPRSPEIYHHGLTAGDDFVDVFVCKYGCHIALLSKFDVCIFVYMCIMRDQP